MNLDEILQKDLSPDIYCLVHNKIVNLEQQVQKQKEVINRAIEFTNKNWGTWCTHHIEYMTELQDILKEVSE